VATGAAAPLRGWVVVRGVWSVRDCCVGCVGSYVCGALFWWWGVVSAGSLLLCLCFVFFCFFFLFERDLTPHISLTPLDSCDGDERAWFRRRRLQRAGRVDTERII